MHPLHILLGLVVAAGRLMHLELGLGTRELPFFLGKLLLLFQHELAQCGTLC